MASESGGCGTMERYRKAFSGEKAGLVLAADPPVAAAPLRGETKPNAHTAQTANAPMSRTPKGFDIWARGGAPGQNHPIST